MRVTRAADMQVAREADTAAADNRGRQTADTEAPDGIRPHSRCPAVRRQSSDALQRTLLNTAEYLQAPEAAVRQELLYSLRISDKN